MIEKDLVWEELELDDLLELGKKSLPQQIQAQQQQQIAAKSKPIAKKMKLLSKPSYSVLMDRYQSLPNAPKGITKSKIDQLADPILGRMTHLEKLTYQQYKNHDLPMSTIASTTNSLLSSGGVLHNNHNSPHKIALPLMKHPTSLN